MLRNKINTCIKEFIWIDAVIGVIGILVILFAALVMQFGYGEQPCPLCLLQRVALINIGIALIMNVRFGNKVSHWALAILSACAGAAVSIRQILLHIKPPDLGFGSSVFGLHMYTWGFIAFVATIVGSALVLLVYPERK